MKYIYMIGVLLRNHNIIKNYKQLKQSENWSVKALEAYQIERLKKLVEFAYTSSLYYRKKLDDTGIVPSDIKDLDDLKKLPLLTKDNLLRNSEAIQVKNVDEKLYFSETSGSTGTPLVFFRNRDWDGWHNASVFRGYSWHGVKPWERNGYLWGYNISPSQQRKIKVLDALQNRFRIFSYKEEDMLEFLVKLKNSCYINGYSSMIFELAKLANKHNIKLHNLKMVKGTSEKIFEVYQKESLKAFGRKIISEYGSAEGGIIAFECPFGKMHVNMETVIVEEIDNEIVLTNLVSKSFPIVRYKLGDYIKLNKSYICECGLKHHIIEEVAGRVGSIIYGELEKYPSLTLYYVFKNLAIQRNIILNYRCIQNIKGVIELHTERSISIQVKSIIQKEFEKYFGNDVRVNILENTKRTNFTSKEKDFISYIQ